MASRQGLPNVKAQMLRELEALNDLLEKRGYKSLYYAVPLPSTTQPTILLPKGQSMGAYAFVMVDEHLKPHNLCPSIHPADLLYRLTEIRHALERHLVPLEERRD